MSRYIDAEEIEYRWLPLTVMTEQFVTKKKIDEMPSADVEPVWHGHWMTKDELEILMKKYYLAIKNALNPYHRSIINYYLNTNESWVKTSLDSGCSERNIWRIIDASARSIAQYMNKQEEKQKVIFISSERRNEQ